jgi:transcriptional regulator with XRE-family HTH domain
VENTTDPMAGIAGRIKVACGRRTYAEIARMTGQHPETVRRYMHGHKPSIEFIAAVSRVFGVSADWLLLGRGEPRLEEDNPLEIIIPKSGARDEAR